jgi:hypothetical protein
MKRQLFLKNLRDLIPKYGSENIIYFDESGFESTTYRDHGWAVRGKKIYIDVTGKREKRTNLIMAQRGRRGKDWLAPMLFQGACSALIVETWVKAFLLKEIKKPSIIIMDNAPVHNKKTIRKLFEDHGHILLPLPPYSPDFNPIEKTFGAMKKLRKSLPEGAVIDDLFHCNS